MSEIKVTFGALSTAQADIRSTWTRINGMLEELEAGLRPIAATWQGEAALFYREKQQQWNNAAVDIGVVLDQIGRAVGSANENYQQVENRNRSLWV
ncbi:MAG: WXG100 family type VII secretion target [Pseudonocardia sp.]|nr:WXG100 family type VII secretion target [Pseudonocardia sp.]